MTRTKTVVIHNHVVQKNRNGQDKDKKPSYERPLSERCIYYGGMENTIILVVIPTTLRLYGRWILGFSPTTYFYIFPSKQQTPEKDPIFFPFTVIKMKGTLLYLKTSLRMGKQNGILSKIESEKTLVVHKGGNMVSENGYQQKEDLSVSIADGEEDSSLLITTYNNACEQYK